MEAPSKIQLDVLDDLLRKGEPESVGQIVTRTGHSPQMVRHSITRLQDRGVIRVAEDGRPVLYEPASWLKYLFQARRRAAA